MNWDTFQKDTRPECRTCPRYEKGVFVKPKVDGKKRLCVLGEAPGEEEKINGLPLLALPP